MIENNFEAQVLTAIFLLPISAIFVFFALRVRSGKMQRWPKTVGNAWQMTLAMGILIFIFGFANLCAAVLHIFRRMTP